MGLDPKVQAAICLHRFGLGPRAGSIAAIASDPRGALIAEIDRPAAGRINDPGLPTSAQCARAAFKFQQEQRAARMAERAARNADAGNAPGGTPSGDDEADRSSRPARTDAQCRARRTAAALSGRSQGSHSCGARIKDRLCGTAGLVLVKPFLRLGGQGKCAADLRRLRA